MSLAFDLFPEPLPHGIQYIPNFIDEFAEECLIDQIDIGSWDQTYKRRRKHFGKAYAAVGGEPQAGIYPGPLPPWLDEIAQLLQAKGLFDAVPAHSLINEYLPGQGIADHTDADDGRPLRVASLSLGSGAEMRFTEPDGRRHMVYLEPRSLVVFQGDTARTWHHGIPGRLADRIGGMTIARDRRISLTFREACSTQN